MKGNQIIPSEIDIHEQIISPTKWLHFFIFIILNAKKKKKIMLNHVTHCHISKVHKLIKSIDTKKLTPKLKGNQNIQSEDDIYEL